MMLSNKMKNMFDYTFYRTTKRHFKKEGSKGAEGVGILALTFITLQYQAGIIGKIYQLTEFKFENKIIEKILYIFMMVLTYFFFYKIYNKKFFKFREKWINETFIQKRIGEIQIVLFFFSGLLFSYILLKVL